MARRNKRHARSSALTTPHRLPKSPPQLDPLLESLSPVQPSLRPGALDINRSATIPPANPPQPSSTLANPRPAATLNPRDKSWNADWFLDQLDPNRHDSKKLQTHFLEEIKSFITRFPDPDICELLAINLLAQSAMLVHRCQHLAVDFHPNGSADIGLCRSYNAALRDFYRALSYLQRRLDRRARLAERKTNPSDAYAQTLYKPDPAPTPSPKPIIQPAPPSPAQSQVAPPPIPMPPTSSSTPAQDNPEKQPQAPAISDLTSNHSGPPQPGAAATNSIPLAPTPFTASPLPT